MLKKLIILKEFDEASQKIEFLKQHSIDIHPDNSGKMQVHLRIENQILRYSKIQSKNKKPCN